MPLDAICLRGVLCELRPQLLGARIDKVQQPARDQILLTLRGNKRLLLNAGANQPRLQLTALPRDNPAQPPMFCMLLRKHLVGARLLSLEQTDLERLVVLTLRCTDEFGEESRKQLVLECMGRRSNLLLLDAQGRILDCLRRVDADLSAARQLLPGLFYRPPAPLDKLSLLSQEEEALALAARGGEEDCCIDRWLLDHFTGISPLVARELAFRAAGATDARFSSLSSSREPLVAALASLSSLLKSDAFTPTILYRDGKPADFTYFPIAQYGAETTVAPRESFSALFDEFYDARERQELSARRGRELNRAVTVARDRMVRKAENLRRDFAATQTRDELRLRGDLITANLYRLKPGERLLRAENYYADGCPLVEIPLDPLLTPQQNAAKCYRQYTKLKTAEFHLSEQLAKAESERAYLESVLQELSQAESEQEFAEIRRELQETGYLRRSGGKKEQKRAFSPRRFRTSSGLEVLVGRSNVQNDQLVKSADKRDLWFHTQKIHGSHVILRCAGLAPSEQDLLECAQLAAFFSQARESSGVPVDFCPVRQVKKPSGARPGMVVYENGKTLFVTPDEAVVKALAAR